MMNPFVERGRITDPERFIGRWRELSVVFERMEGGRPVVVTGTAGIGKSSLLTHVAQSAGVNLERPDMQAFYIDMGVLPDAAVCYALLTKALGSRGDTAAAVEVALLQVSAPVVVCLDRVEMAVAAGWGVDVLERLARIARHSAGMIRPKVVVPPRRVYPPQAEEPEADAAQGRGLLDALPALLVVAAAQGRAPVLSEPFAVVGLGAFSPAEVRLLTDTYLTDTGVQFSASEVRELATLSVGHPAYLQRAAFHLFASKTQPGYDWQAAYLDEARDRPVPGAPLPEAVFEGEMPQGIGASYGGGFGQAETRQPEPLVVTGPGEVLVVFGVVIGALLAWQVSGSLLVGLVVFAAGVALVVAAGKKSARG